MAKIDREKLKQELIWSLEAGQMSEGFAVIAISIIGQTINSRTKHLPKAEREEMIGLAYVKLMRNWQNIDPEKYPASYISRIGLSSYGDEMRKYETKRKKLENFEEHEKNKDRNINSAHPIRIDIRKLEIKYRNALKKKAMHMIKMGLSYRAVTRALNISTDTTVRKWHRQYKEQGKEFFKDSRRNNNRWI